MEIAIGAGADDYSDQGEDWQVLTPPADIDAVVKALEDAKITVKSNSVGSVPKVTRLVTGRDAELALKLVDMLEDHDDIQNVYANFDISDEELANMEG